MRFLTDFGDQAVILPAFIVAGCVLLAQRRRVLAGAWVLAVAGVLGTTLVLKLADQSCGWTVPALAAADLMNPSGHTAVATALFGCGVGTLLAERGWRTVVVTAGTGLAVATIIGTTRVMLGAHTVPEAVAGAAVGLAGAVVFGWLASKAAPGRGGAGRARGLGSAGLPVLAAMAAIAAVHGRHLGAEPNIHGFSVRTIRGLVPACRPPPGSDPDRWIERRSDT